MQSFPQVKTRQHLKIPASGWLKLLWWRETKNHFRETKTDLLAGATLIIFYQIQQLKDANLSPQDAVSEFSIMVMLCSFPKPQMCSWRVYYHPALQAGNTCCVNTRAKRKKTTTTTTYKAANLNVKRGKIYPANRRVNTVCARRSQTQRNRSSGRQNIKLISCAPLSVPNPQLRWLLLATIDLSAC